MAEPSDDHIARLRERLNELPPGELLDEMKSLTPDEQLAVAENDLG
jgi:hypothetical protein